MRPPALYVSVIVVVLCVQTVMCRVMFPSDGVANLNNVQFYNDTVYLAGNSKLYVLSQDLLLQEEINTCSGDSCDNVNKILLVNHYTEELITCGTNATNGTCQLRPLTNLRHISQTSATVDPYTVTSIVLSGNPVRPAVGLVAATGYLYLGTTWASESDAVNVGLHDYAFNFLSSRTNNFEYEKDLYYDNGKVIRLDVSESDYLIFFRSAFEDNWFTYFLTNQKRKNGDTDYVSKIIRVCQNDTELRSYTDAEIECSSPDGSRYKLAQRASLFTPGLHLQASMNLGTGEKVLAVTFTNSTDPEYPNFPSSSAICLYSLNQINGVIRAVKKSAMTCNDTSLSQAERYLTTTMDSPTPPYCLRNDQAELYMDCPQSYYFHYYITGMSERISSTSVYTTSDDIIPVLGSLVPGTDYTHMYLGTRNGKLLMVTIMSSTVGHQYYTLDVDPEYPILAIHQQGDAVYAMSDRKLVRYEVTDCSEYSTCTETMDGRNPHCGWCVYSSRSTRSDSCSAESNHWLSALGSCVSINIQPHGAAINTATDVIVSTSRLPVNMSGDSYECRFVHGTSVRPAPAQFDTATSFTCTAPSIPGHTDGQFQLYVNHGSTSIMLAETHFLFYDCQHYNRCGSCVGGGADCQWCPVEPRCQLPTATCDHPIQSTQLDACPRLENNNLQHYIPSGVDVTLKLTVANVDAGATYTCHISGKSTQAEVANSTVIQCPVQVGYDDEDSEKKFPITVKYGTTSIQLDDDYQNTVTVYRCEYGDNFNRRDCSQCGALNTVTYDCHWCDAPGCGYSASCTPVPRCPPPLIHKVLPSTAPVRGNTRITIHASELGSHLTDITDLKLGNISCAKETSGFIVSKRVVCTTGHSDKVNVNTTVTVVVNGQSGQSVGVFSFLEPVVMNMTPTSGPVAGGTRVTITGLHLGVGNQQVSVQFEYLNEMLTCKDARVVSDVQASVPYVIQCETAPGDAVNTRTGNLHVTLDGMPVSIQKGFTYLTDPTISGVIPKKAISRGGTRVTVTGKDMDNAHDASVTIVEDGEEKHESACIEKTDALIVCKTPELTDTLRHKLSGQSDTRRKREAGCSDCIPVVIRVKLDGVYEEFTIDYFADPEFHMFEEGDGVRLYKPEDQYITIKGERLNLVATVLDVQVTVGVNACSVQELTSTSLRCLPPKQQPVSKLYGRSKAEVNVSVGNVHKTVGYIAYKQTDSDDNLAIIVGAIGGCLAALLIGILIGCIKYRRMGPSLKKCLFAVADPCLGQRARNFQESLVEMESESKSIVREEFADMHTSMSMVNTNLVQQGFPYHGYHPYAFNVMFPADAMDSHPLLHYPSVSDDVRTRMKSGLALFESLVYNKFFLTSVISSMEAQKKFLLKDKSNMVGNITTLLLGRMGYLQEILCVLLTNLVNNSERKTQKSIFRRCESITEKLLHNWLCLCLYPYFKSQLGSPLYLLYKTTQIIMESGPIDAVTNDAKYTLCEEKLLKKYNQQARDGSNDITFEPKNLTLKVVVDNCSDIHVCRVLDCDTVTQVKQKCLSQIYVNLPASSVTLAPTDLQLQWHRSSGSLNLRDEDNTSKRDGAWTQLNTLAHYNVHDGSNMAIEGVHYEEIQDYVNVAQIQLEPNTSRNRSFNSSEPLTGQQAGDDEESPAPMKWHIVRPEGESQEQGKSSIDKLYLNRLFTTKQSIVEHVQSLFDVVLNAETVPPPVKFLYDFLDKVADAADVEPDTVHLWKSHSYPIRVCASLIRRPASLFDINSPSYVDSNMDIISQAFIESFNITSQSLGQNSPAYKLIFHEEVLKYQEQVLQFYMTVRDQPPQPETLRQYLGNVNKVQSESARFNNTSALYQFYMQLQPYMTQILADLANNKETSSLQLDRKLQNVISTLQGTGDND